MFIHFVAFLTDIGTNKTFAETSKAWNMKLKHLLSCFRKIMHCLSLCLLNHKKKTMENENTKSRKFSTAFQIT